jgi:hypothetical protein
MKFLYYSIEAVTPSPLGQTQPITKPETNQAGSSIFRGKTTYHYELQYKQLIHNGQSVSITLLNRENNRYCGQIIFSLDENNALFAEVKYDSENKFYTNTDDLRKLIYLMVNDNSISISTGQYTSRSQGSSFNNYIRTYIPGGLNYKIKSISDIYKGKPIPIVQALVELLDNKTATIAETPTPPIVKQQSVLPEIIETPLTSLISNDGLNRHIAREILNNQSSKLIEDMYIMQGAATDGSYKISSSLREYQNARDTLSKQISEHILDNVTLGIRKTLRDQKIQNDINQTKLKPNEYYKIDPHNPYFNQLSEEYQNVVLVAFYDTKILDVSAFRTTNPFRSLPAFNSEQQLKARSDIILYKGLTRESLNEFCTMINVLSETTVELKEIKDFFLAKVQIYEFILFNDEYDRNPTLENTKILITQIKNLPAKYASKADDYYRKIYYNLLQHPFSEELKSVGREMPDPFGKQFR